MRNKRRFQRHDENEQKRPLRDHVSRRARIHENHDHVGMDLSHSYHIILETALVYDSKQQFQRMISDRSCLSCVCIGFLPCGRCDASFHDKKDYQCIRHERHDPSDKNSLHPLYENLVLFHKKDCEIPRRKICHFKDGQKMRHPKAS